MTSWPGNWLLLGRWGLLASWPGHQLRNITFEICAWGFGNVETFGSGMGHLWRTRYLALHPAVTLRSPDITDTWEGMLWNIDINDEPRYRQPGVQGPGRGWNYPDGLFVGAGGMTDPEYRSMFALWCLAKAPLMLGSDLRTLARDSPAYRSLAGRGGGTLPRILTNPGLLAVNQDPLGVQGECVKDCCSHGSTGGITSPQTCYHFSHSWQVGAWQTQTDRQENRQTDNTVVLNLGMSRSRLAVLLGGQKGQNVKCLKNGKLII